MPASPVGYPGTPEYPPIYIALNIMADPVVSSELDETPLAVAPVHGSASILLATLIGGPFAAAYLVRSNLALLGREIRPLRYVLTLMAIGIVALYIAMQTPPDFVSQFLSTTLLSLFLVGLYLVFLNRRIPPSEPRAKRSLWYGVAAGIVVNLAVNGFVFKLTAMQEAWKTGFSAWEQRR